MERIEGRDEIGPWVIWGEDVPDAPRRSIPPPPSPPRKRPLTGLITLGCMSPFLLVFYLLFRVTNPSDWVEVTARSVPADARWVYLLAESEGRSRGLVPYHSKVLPFPDRYPCGFGRGGLPVSIEWRDADRYAALARMRDGTWKLWRLGPDDVRKPFVWRHVVGGGTAEFRVPDSSRAEVPTREFVDGLDLGPP
jgi:hypothetical protein